jgi:hypothetical protein
MSQNIAFWHIISKILVLYCQNFPKTCIPISFSDFWLFNLIQDLFFHKNWPFLPFFLNFMFEICLWWLLSSKFYLFNTTILAKIGFLLFRTWSSTKKYVCMGDYGLFIKFRGPFRFLGGIFKNWLSDF